MGSFSVNEAEPEDVLSSQTVLSTTLEVFVGLWFVTDGPEPPEGSGAAGAHRAQGLALPAGLFESGDPCCSLELLRHSPPDSTLKQKELPCFFY